MNDSVEPQGKLEEKGPCLFRLTIIHLQTYLPKELRLVGESKRRSVFITRRVSLSKGLRKRYLFESVTRELISDCKPPD